MHNNNEDIYLKQKSSRSPPVQSKKHCNLISKCLRLQFASFCYSSINILLFCFLDYNASMPSKFIHLHTHSHYSLLNALPKIPELVKEAKKNEMSALALTDNANLYGAIEFYKACKKENIKPIIGADMYVATRTRNDKQGGVDNRRSRLVLLVKDLTGYHNLIKLVTLANLEGFYYKPRIDKELIEKYAEGLICLSPSFSGAITQALKNSDQEEAKRLVSWYKKVYGKENFY